MSESTQPRDRGLHSIKHAGVAFTPHGDGSEHARLIWLVLMSHTRWPGKAPQEPWATNVTLAYEAGIHPRDVAAALACLRRAGVLTTPPGCRPTARRKWGRLLVPRLAAPAKILIPERGAMTNIWIVCRSARPRPAALVTAMVGAHIMAASGLDRSPDGWAPIGAKAADLRRFVGASKGSTWGRRVNDLCDLGLLERRDQLWVAPPCEWYTAWRAIRNY